MASAALHRPQNANLRHFTPERARQLAPRAVAARILANRQRALDRQLKSAVASRATISGSRVLAIVAKNDDRVTRIEQRLDELTRVPSKREYIERGVERHLGPAINPPPRPPSRRKRDERSDANRVARGEQPLNGMLPEQVQAASVAPAPAEAFASPLALGPAKAKS